MSKIPLPAIDKNSLLGKVPFMQHYQFSSRFSDLYELALEKYRSGYREVQDFFSPEDREWIRNNGLCEQNFFDYAEDHLKYGAEPGLLIAHAIESIRRDFFFSVQGGCPSSQTLDPDSMPGKTASIDGIEWLPRLVPKALAKLKGELPASLMYCCAGDRRFFKQYNIHPAEFLTRVWRYRDGDTLAHMLEFVKARASV